MKKPRFYVFMLKRGHGCGPNLRCLTGFVVIMNFWPEHAEKLLNSVKISVQ
jgi:hypothetical protein